MLRTAIASSIRARFLVLFAAAAVLIVGILQASNQSIDLLPEFSPPQIEVQTEALGLAAAEVEALVTVQLEEILGGVPWLQSMDSRSMDGLSSIAMRFEAGTDIMDARQMVQERLLRTSILPKVAKRPMMLQPVSSSNRVLNIGLSSASLSLIDISVLARWNIKPKLMGLPGVANVAIWGQRERQLQVQVDPEQLRTRGVRLIDVIKATGDALYSSPLTYLQASTPGTGGFIDTPNQRLDIRHVLPISTSDDLSQVAFRTQGGSILRLGEVASVVEGHPPLIGDGTVNDAPGLMLIVEKFPWANTLDVTREVEATLKTLAPGLPGLEMDTTIFRPAGFVELSVGNIALVLAFGAGLGLVALALGFVGWRPALVSVVAMALSLTTAVLVLLTLGTAFNMLVLAGLAGALALVIHDAVADTHNIRRRLRENAAAGNLRTPTALILQAATEIRSPVLCGTLVCVAAILPLLAVGGLNSAFFMPLGLAFLAAVAASSLVAVTVTPALALIVMSAGGGDLRTFPWVSGLGVRYNAVLARLLGTPRPVLAVTIATLVVGLAALPLASYQLIPAFEERDFLMRWNTAPGTSYPEMSRITAEASQALRAVPGVRNVGAQIGRAIESDRVEDINSAELWVSLDPKADYGTTVTAIQSVAERYPGLRPEALSFSATRIEGVLAGQDGAFTARIYGPDQALLRSKAEEVRQALARIDGITVADVPDEVLEPQLEIEVNLVAVEQHGLSPGEVRRAATTLLAGLEVGTLYEDQKVFEVVVWGVPEIRDNPAQIGELLIDKPDGGQVRLADVADVRMVSNPTFHERHGASHAIDLRIQLSGRDANAITSKIEQAFATIEFPLQYHPELLSQPLGEKTPGIKLLAYALAACAGIFLLLQVISGSWAVAAMGLLVLSTSLVGGLLASLLLGGTIYLGSLLGFVAILGIASRDLLLLIQHCRNTALADEPSILDLVLRVATERFDPIIISVLTAGLVFLPMVVLGARPGLEILHPMAVVVLGGLVTATLVNLFLAPALYGALQSRPVSRSNARVGYAAL